MQRAWHTKDQRVVKPKEKRTITVNRTITGSNQLWEMDIRFMSPNEFYNLHFGENLTNIEIRV